MQYQTLRSISDNHLHLLCRDEEFEKLPDYIRHQGPWQGMRRGDVTKLKRNYRLRLAGDGCALVTSALAVFKPEA
jgi:hypothetical protein